MPFVIANFRHVADGLQEGQFAIGERKRAASLDELDRIWTKYTGNQPPYGLRDPKIDEKRVLFVCRIDRIATFGKP